YVDADDEPSGIPQAILRKKRVILGRPFDPSAESYAFAVRALIDEMMDRFIELNVRAFETGLDLLVFPQGGRSIRLSKGRIGLAQIALHTRKTIVPISANNVDRIYPGGSIMAKGG